MEEPYIKPHITKKKNTVKLYRPWWSTTIVCVCSTKHIAPPNGLGRQRQRQITKRFYS